nr:immunoglobulin heavy chain junction region [Macaca mulatta]MOW19604.1 immunoglobulin heavy chain junction region [Macaca mulatta]MOW20107.1 immunoglobulin heavy chain junction region [Macaca mulatta]MOW20277.1 immunoglobulin heavy chain junction region [Macaca mulatta]MOW20335.1 immunoglobulin heavy chain junction region [Macaca mulatta]
CARYAPISATVPVTTRFDVW